MLSNLLPDDLVINILLKQRVKTLLRFRCVCKHWCKLISNPNFVNMHLDKAVENQQYFSLMLIRDYKMYSSFINYDSSSLTLTFYYQNVEIDRPFKYGRVLASLNGLLLIGRAYYRDYLISLWNPSTREYKNIPEAPLYNGEYIGSDVDESLDGCKFVQSLDEPVCGFGYDRKMEDYKVVRVDSPVAYFGSKSNRKCILLGCHVAVYSLRTSSWKHIPVMFRYTMDGTNRNDAVFVNGCLHWRATHLVKGIEASSKSTIVSFGLEDERLTDVSPLEPFDDNKLDIDITIGNLGGCLCLFVGRRSIDIEVWVMKDYGVRESWTKLFTIDVNSLSFKGFSTDCLKPIESFKNGEILFITRLLGNDNHTAVVLYDPKHESVRTLEIDGGKWYFSNIYIESLVSLNTELRLSH